MKSIARRPDVARVSDWPSALHPVVRQVLAKRELDTTLELELKLQYLLPVGRVPALDEAVALLLECRDKPIVIVGDFDADGATSTALLMLALARFGFASVDYFIPDRFKLGYGLSPGAVAALPDSDGGLIVTVDNGISSVDGVEAAKARGYRVLVTDHHLPGPTLPAADVIVNPNINGSGLAGGNLAGVGVAFYLVAALGRALDQARIAAEFLDLVALGTVADLVRLDHSNRILVEQGLRRIRAGACRPGLLALCKAAGLDHGGVIASTLGFQLGPRLNAAGRLDDMSIGVRCLLTEDAREAAQLATELDHLNRSRREIEGRMRDEALALVDQLDIDESSDGSSAVCLMQEDWHEGIVGLVASRVKDRVHRPAFAFAPTGVDELKGSGRSISGFHLRDALADVDARRPGLITRFGGHAMAAGLTLPRGRFSEFSALIGEVARDRLGNADLTQRVMSDGSLEPADLNLEVARVLRDTLPWGQGFPEPCFDGQFELIESRVLKGAHLKVTVKPVGSSCAVEGIAFNAADVEWAPGTARTIAYRLDVNDYFSTPREQLVIEHIAAPGEDVLDVD